MAMSDAERERALKKLAEIDAQLEQERMMDPKGVAGAFSEPVPVTDKPKVVMEGKGSLQKAAEFGVPLATTMYGAAKGAELIAPIASSVPTPAGKAIVTGIGAVGGAALAGTGTELSIQAVQSAMGLPGAPDSIDDSYRRTLAAGFGEGQAELIGRTVLGPVTSAITPFRRAMNPESADVLKTMANRVRATYEEIGGAPLVEETRKWWSLGRIMEPLDTELKDNAVYKRLQDAGLDPEVARRVAVTGGAVPSRLDTTITSKFWDMVGSRKMVPDEAYEQARSKLLHFSTLNDLGSNFADRLAPEEMGKSVIAALTGRFDTLDGLRTTAMQTLEDKIPKGYKLDITPLRRSMGATKSVQGPSGMTLQGFPTAASKRPGAKVILGLPDNATFAEVLAARQTIGNMSRDGRLTDAARKDLRDVMWEMDNATRDALPPRLRSTFRKWTTVDSDINKAGFDAHFVAGMLHKKENALLYANKIIDNQDAGNFALLETALKGAPDGPRILGQVKGAIAERFFGQSVSKAGVLQPNMLSTALGNNTRGYGKYFLEATLGPEYVKSLNHYIHAMETVDKAVAAAGSTARVGVTLAGTLTGISGLWRGGATGSMPGGMFTTLVAATFSPMVVSKALTHPTASKLLVKTAENMAAGRNPKTTARLAARVMEAVGLTPEEALQEMVGGGDVTPRQQAATEVQQQMTTGGQPPPMTGGAPLPAT